MALFFCTKILFIFTASLSSYFRTPIWVTGFPPHCEECRRRGTKVHIISHCTPDRLHSDPFYLMFVTEQVTRSTALRMGVSILINGIGKTGLACGELALCDTCPPIYNCTLHLNIPPNNLQSSDAIPIEDRKVYCSLSLWSIEDQSFWQVIFDFFPQKLGCKYFALWSKTQYPCLYLFLPARCHEEKYFPLL